MRGNESLWEAEVEVNGGVGGEQSRGVGVFFCVAVEKGRRRRRGEGRGREEAA